MLASEERESARARLRAALVRHWLFESFDSKQIEATAKAMRHQSVPQGKAVSAQGEAATKFYVVTEGGFDLTVATEADPAVLVAQALTLALTPALTLALALALALAPTLALTLTLHPNRRVRRAPSIPRR